MDGPRADPQWFKDVYEHSSTGVVALDQAGRVLFANPAARRLLGDGAALDLGRVEAVIAALAGSAAMTDSADEAVDGVAGPAVHRIGEHDCQLSRVRYTCPNGTPFSVIELIDLTAFQRREQELMQRLHRDTLTGLASREAFFAAAGRLIRERRRAFWPLAVAMLDLDAFKAVNDTAGHAIGDGVLVAVADACRQALREEDVIGRLGGDEFALLLPGTALAEAELVAERLRRAVQDATHLHELAGRRVTLSIGAALWRPGETTIGPALKRADAALYRAKATGGDRIMQQAV